MNDITRNIIRCILFAFSLLIALAACLLTFSLDRMLPLFLNSVFFVFAVIVLVLLLITVLILNLILKCQGAKKRLFPLYPLFAGVLGIAGIIIYQNTLDSSPLVMSAKHYEDIAGNVYMEFGEDGRYRLDYYGFLDGMRYRGKYTIAGDTIFLSEDTPIAENKEYMTNKLLIEEDYIYFQLDSVGNYDKYFKMHIYKPLEYESN
ncbi:hypothetical protein [Dysgonomonas sp. 25]|uniref:hypothetical protein n=1 Tax=Dysgonomonas sp. 25 TaxID=2302933 RepID=UPI0013D6515B|nr:hypothetical protein [Dysgonomonas sp. 25]NDV69216.1 hypothetical protein [Dysgonomonas sp. 25]